MIEDFVMKSTKLENQIRSTSFAFSAFLESFQKIAHKALNTKGSFIFKSIHIHFVKANLYIKTSLNAKLWSTRQIISRQS